MKDISNPKPSFPSLEFRADAQAMKTVAALMNDPNPIHWDINTVRAMGIGERPINQGPVTVCYLLNLAMKIVGSPGRIRQFNARFLANVQAGDVVNCIVTDMTFNEDSGTTECALSALVGDKEVVKATFQALPLAKASFAYQDRFSREIT